ncbi:MAG: restriction endonuclease [Candidatus Accumulibacter sp. UW20]
MSELNKDVLATLGELADEPIESTGPTGDFVYVDISSIDRETKKISDPKSLTLSQAPSRAKQVLKTGDVLVSMTRPNLNAVALVPEQLDGAIGSTGFHVLRSRWLSPGFLLALVQTQNFIDAMSSVVQGALYPAVRPRDIAAYAFSFETPVQQTRIVAKLEELLSDLDAGVAELKAAQKKFGQYRQSLLKAAVEGALTADWRAQHPPTETGAQLLQRILTERRTRWETKQLARFKEQGKTPPKDWQKKYPDPVQPDTTDLPGLPEGWVWVQICQTGDVQLGRQRAPQFHTGSNMVPYLRVANVFEDRIDISDVMEMHFSSDEEENFRLLAQDVLLNEGQSLELIGRPAIYRGELPRACFTNTLVRYRADVGVLPEFALALFLHYMHSGRFRKIATITTNIAHLGVGRFAQVEFPLPSTEEQAVIVDLLKEQMDNLERQKHAISVALKQSTAQRQNILRAAFSGQLVPQDPNDEPASVLLERIRAERAAQAAMHKSRVAANGGRKTRHEN